MFTNKTILVTGGTGSFGNFIVHRLLQLGTREVRVLSRDEKKQYDMRVLHGGRRDLTFVIGDIRNRDSVDEAMHGVDIVFQAAALKQVPTCEYHPMEAVRTNVLGADNVVTAALDHGVDRFITVSTDKAAKPVNVMGMTKALQERLVLHANLSRRNQGTKLACVRYGNVLRSRGSVVPFFRRQLARGEQPTITDEGMTRFLLTLNDAIDLVLYAAEATTGGEVFIRKAPSARIVDLAKALAAMADKPFSYRVIGMLPGEKLNEILISEEEMIRAEDAGEYWKVHPWWTDYRSDELMAEYSSGQALCDADTIRGLIERADREFEAMELGGGEYANF
jgi:UDP-glucose 4-epimerase